MVSRIEYVQELETRRRSRVMLGQTGFAFSAWIVEFSAILALSVITGVAYHFVAYGSAGMIDQYARLGFFAALFYTLPFLFRNEFHIYDYLEGTRSPSRIAWVWCYAFVCLGVIGFLIKTTETHSRGWLAILFVCGPVALIAVDGFICMVLRRLISAERIHPRRLMLVGEDDDIERMKLLLEGAHCGARVVATASVPLRHFAQQDAAGAGKLRACFDDAVKQARLTPVDDVIVYADWSHRQVTETAIEAFSMLPVAIHLGASDVIGHFRNAKIWRFAELATLSITNPPLTAIDALTKRLFDVLASMIALVLLSPVFAIIALLIKLDSRGRVFFRQRRRGFNYEEFRIWKFRTMSTMDDGDNIVQASHGDHRVTRVGRYLRRFNLDELPQLINVLRGEMSLVGPRPHAVAHDRHYEARIVTYPRRLSVRPGITGWAQVHGFRGATGSDDAMQQRLDYDLYYIDNWSIGLDFYIMALTVLSPRAYSNAH